MRKTIFSLKRKTTGQTPNNFTIIKLITIILVYVSRLKKNLSSFPLLSHILIISLKDGNTLLSPPYFFSPRTALSLGCLLSLSSSLLAASSILFVWLTFFSVFFNMRHTLSYSSEIHAHLLKPNKPCLIATYNF